MTHEDSSILCECGRKLNLTDWHYGRCVKCRKPVPYKTWKGLIVEGATEK